MVQLPGRGVVERLAVGPRVDEVTATDPEAAAEAIALDQGAEVVADEVAAAAAVTARRAAAALDAAGIAELRRLADVLDRTQRISARTAQSVHDGIAQRLARTSGLALHPTSIRDAAAAVVDAEHALAAADSFVVRDVDQPGAHREKRTWWRRRRRARAAVAQEPAVTETSPATLDVERTRAEERLRSARRHWERLVGPKADPHDLDAVLRLHDPQLDFGAADTTSPTIRAASAVERRARARWRVAWAQLGYDVAPTLEGADAELERLAAGATRAVVVVEPDRWPAGEDGLAELLDGLPSGTPVTVVRRRPVSDAIAS